MISSPDQVQQVVELGELDAHHAGLRGVARVAPLDGAPGGGVRGAGRRRRRLPRGDEQPGRRGTAGAGAGRAARDHALEVRALGPEVARLRPLPARVLDRVAQGGGAREQAVEGLGLEGEGPVAHVREHVLEPVHVVLDPGEPDHPAVALEGMQGAEDGVDRLLVRALALEGEQAVVEGLEVLAGVLEIDGEQLGGDLEVGHGVGRPAPSPPQLVVIFSMSPCSSEAWKGFLTYPFAPILRPRIVSSSFPSVEMMMTGMAW